MGTTGQHFFENSLWISGRALYRTGLLGTLYYLAVCCSLMGSLTGFSSQLWISRIAKLALRVLRVRINTRGITNRSRQRTSKLIIAQPKTTVEELVLISLYPAMMIRNSLDKNTEIKLSHLVGEIELHQNKSLSIRRPNQTIAKKLDEQLSLIYSPTHRRIDSHFGVPLSDPTIAWAHRNQLEVQRIGLENRLSFTESLRAPSTAVEVCIYLPLTSPKWHEEAVAPLEPPLGLLQTISNYRKQKVQ